MKQFYQNAMLAFVYLKVHKPTTNNFLMFKILKIYLVSNFKTFAGHTFMQRSTELIYQVLLFLLFCPLLIVV